MCQFYIVIIAKNWIQEVPNPILLVLDFVDEPHVAG